MALSDAKFKRLCERKVEWLKTFAPKDTGNLAYSAIKMEMPSPDVCEIYIDESVAPYMKFTEFPWFSPKWHGKKNPNEGWFEQAASVIYYSLAEDLGGEGNENLDEVWNNYESWSEGYFKWQRTKQR